MDREPSTLQERFQHTLLLIAEWAELQQKADAERVATARRKGETVVAVDPTDRLEPFKRAFQQLLSPKRLIDPDPQSQTLQFDLDGKPFPLDALSSGEKECVNIIFDFVAYSPADCIILFDEPELHLHPELSYNLINTLRTQGTRNQIVLCTHSSHIITSSLQHTVVFMAPPEKRDGNQAILVEEDDETHEALMLLGQSIGVISLGRKIVLIEGGHSSIDKYVYYNVVKEKRPEFVLVPCESKHIVSSFSAINRKVLTNTLWGIDFFMICDKDAVPYGESVIDLEERSRGRLKLLPRYHIENYFLDEGVLVGVFSAFESEDSWLRSEDAISTKLRAIAKERLSYAVALVVAAELRRKVGNLDLMPRRCHHLEIDKLVAVIMDKVAEEKGRIDELLNAKHVESIAHGVYRQLESSLDNGDEWKAVIPGREIFRIFANATRMDVNRLTRAYINEASNHAPYPFQDILDIFDHFAGLDRTVGSA